MKNIMKWQVTKSIIIMRQNLKNMTNEQEKIFIDNLLLYVSGAIFSLFLGIMLIGWIFAVLRSAV